MIRMTFATWLDRYPENVSKGRSDSESLDRASF